MRAATPRDQRHLLRNEGTICIVDDIVEPPKLFILGLDDPVPAPHPPDSHSLSPLNPLRPLWLGLPLGFGVSSDGKLLEDRDHA